MDDEWEELQSPWQIEAVHFDDHFPSRHESASVPPENQEQPPASPPSSSASSSPTPPPESPPAAAAAASLRLRLWIASAEVRRTASKAVAAWRFWTVAAVAGAAAAFLVHLLYRRLRSRWRPRPPAIRDGNNRDRLAVLLREKDEKIGQLLVRIAEMNEALSARRRVPVIRVS